MKTATLELYVCKHLCPKQWILGPRERYFCIVKLKNLKKSLHLKGAKKDSIKASVGSQHAQKMGVGDLTEERSQRFSQVERKAKVLLTRQSPSWSGAKSRCTKKNNNGGLPYLSIIASLSSIVL